MSQAVIAAEAPWYRLLNRSQWNTLIASNLGWMFDGYETFALVMAIGSALRQLLDPSQYSQIPTYAGTVIGLTLLEVVRNEFSLYGARESCGQGLCGCCTLIVDGRAVSGCLYLATFADGTRVETVEYLDRDNVLDPVQEAFIEQGAFQCGFCTPGFVLMVKQLLDEHPDPDDERIRDYLSGNLCRCAAYPEIIQAVKSAARKRQAGKPA